MVFKGTVPEDILKHEYICIFHWLFSSVHMLLVQSSRNPQAPRHLHTWATDPSSLPGFLPGQIHTWIWRDLRNVKADFTEFKEWQKSHLIWSWWDESRAHPPLGLVILVDYHGGCSAFAALSHPTFQHCVWNSSSSNFLQRMNAKGFQKLSNLQPFLINMLWQPCIHHSLYYSLFSLSWFTWFRNHILGHVISQVTGGRDAE